MRVALWLAFATLTLVDALLRHGPAVGDTPLSPRDTPTRVQKRSQTLLASFLAAVSLGMSSALGHGVSRAFRNFNCKSLWRRVELHHHPMKPVDQGLILSRILPVFDMCLSQLLLRRTSHVKSTLHPRHRPSEGSLSRRPCTVCRRSEPRCCRGLTLSRIQGAFCPKLRNMSVCPRRPQDQFPPRRY